MTAETFAVKITVSTRLTSDQVGDVLALIHRATEADGVGPLSEHVVLHLRTGGDRDVRHAVAIAPDGRLVGYAHMDVTDAVAGPSGELVVDPKGRRHGVGTALVQALKDSAGNVPVRVWAHGDLPDAARFAAAAGMKPARQLRQLRRSLLAPLPKTELPEGISIRAFVPGKDEAEWLALNTRAFADHPDQGSWTIHDLAVRMGEDWFDPAGFLLAERTDSAGPRLVGFHWTKVHGDGVAHSHEATTDHHRPHAHDPMGEVYVVGVDPSERGHGLGRALTIAGLVYLRARGLPMAMLYVDADNTPAIALYESLGFAPWDVDVMYRL
jgi:mycothiol synthase